MQELEQLTTDLVEIVLVYEHGTKETRKWFKNAYGFSTIAEFISYISEKANVSEDKAKEIIYTDPLLLRIAFILA